MRISDISQWNLAQTNCKQGGMHVLDQHVVLQSDFKCPPKSTISVYYDVLKFRLQGPKTSLEKKVNGEWVPYHMIGCCYAASAKKK